MSTLDKSIQILRSLPDDQIAAAYMYLLSLSRGNAHHLVLMDTGELLCPNKETASAMEEADFTAMVMARRTDEVHCVF